MPRGREVGEPYEQVVWSPRYIDAPVLRDRDADDDSETGDLGVTDSGLDQRFYYTTDANMNVTALIGTDGSALERYVYDPYGEVTIYDDDWSDTRSSSSLCRRTRSAQPERNPAPPGAKDGSPAPECAVGAGRTRSARMSRSG